MKVVILAGGLGSRISEETQTKPKPMVEIGGMPIIWHILKIYSHFGFNDFIICCGFKGYVIKEYFANYSLHSSDITIDMSNKSDITIHQSSIEPWKITLVNTGELTQTGGRLKRIRNYLNKNESFCMTYGDGVSDVNVRNLVSFHLANKCEATLTAVKPPGRFGAIKLIGSLVNNFQEKPDGDNSWINGGFFVLKDSVLDKIEGDSSSWENDILPKLSSEKNLNAFNHDGFWQPMDTMRDKEKLEELWKSGKAPWYLWRK